MKPTAILTGILIISTFDNVQCEIVTKPADKVVEVNRNVIMKCSSKDVSDICELEWKHYKVKSRTGNVVYYNSQLTADFKSYISIANDIDGNCNLKIKGTSSAAGTYECVDTSNGDSASAELIIIDPNYRIKGTVSECFARYYGNCDLPMLQWMESNGDGWNPIDAVDQTSSPNFTSTTILTPTQTLMCKITVSKSARLLYEWHAKIITGTTTETAPQISTTCTCESLSTKVTKNASLEAGPLSNASNESVSMAAIVGIVIGVFIVSCGLT